MINRILILILFFSLSVSIAIAGNEQAGFDEICRIYTEALNSNMPKQQMSDYVFDNVKKRVQVKDALEAHSAVFNLAPQERYTIFKQSAEMSLKNSWDCPAAKELMQ